MEMVNNKKNIIILSCGTGVDSLPANFADIVSRCTTLVGGKRLLDLFPNYTGEKIVIDKHIKETLAKLAENPKDIVILASGDALFHGIAKTVLQIIPKEQVKIIPNITAAQALCAKIALPWDNAALLSLHGKNPDDINWPQISRKLPVIIYGDHRCNSANIAKKLIQANPKSADEIGGYNAAIGINLGMDDEEILIGTLKEMSERSCTGLSVLAIFANTSRDLESLQEESSAIFGRVDSEFSHHNNMITHSEIRAVVLSKLRLKPGIMWDLGAGSGSVGIEAALLQPALEVYSVEKDIGRVDDIKNNMKKFDSNNVNIICGNALTQIQNLPDPDTVFIGGGGDDVAEILKNSYAHLKRGGRIIATAVLLETRTALANTMKEQCSEVISISVSRSKKLGNSRIMKAENNIEIYVYIKE